MRKDKTKVVKESMEMRNTPETFCKHEHETNETPQIDVHVKALCLFCALCINKTKLRTN